MTQPDEYVPSGALSSTGLSAYATKTQEDWEDEQKALVTGRFSGAQTGFGLLVAKVPIIQDTVEIFTGVEDGDRTDLGSAVNLFKSTVGNAWNGLFGSIKNTWNGFWNGVYGTNATGKNPNDVVTAAAAVAQTANTASQAATTAATNATDSLTKHTNLLTSLRGGYSIDIINSTSTWTKPTGLSEIFVVCFGGGAKGSNGQRGTGATAQPGGNPGAVIAVQLDPKDVPATVSCTIGGNTSATPSTTSFGTLVTTDDAYGGYVATPLGVILTGASPSKGGSGGLSSGNGASGATTTVGLTGGAGGSFNATGNAFPGSAGKTGLVFAGNLCQTGGSGGGGGGGTSNSGFVAGNGGQGGFPGGGGGGGGNGNSSSPATSTGGNGGLGLILVIYKLATN